MTLTIWTSWKTNIMQNFRTRNNTHKTGVIKNYSTAGNYKRFLYFKTLMGLVSVKGDQSKENPINSSYPKAIYFTDGSKIYSYAIVFHSSIFSIKNLIIKTCHICFMVSTFLYLQLSGLHSVHWWLGLLITNKQLLYKSCINFSKK